MSLVLTLKREDHAVGQADFLTGPNGHHPTPHAMTVDKSAIGTAEVL